MTLGMFKTGTNIYLIDYLLAFQTDKHDLTIYAIV
jgi:hypothetical protein